MLDQGPIAIAASAIFFGAMLHVAVTDILHRRIRNRAMMVLAIFYLPLAMLSGLSAGAILVSAAAAIAVFAGGVGCFAAGWVGGGDVKLAALSALWLGSGLVLPYLLLAAVFGAVVSLAILAAGRLGQRRQAGRDACAALPYGPGMACAALLLFDRSPWFQTF